MATLQHCPNSFWSARPVVTTFLFSFLISAYCIFSTRGIRVTNKWMTWLMCLALGNLILIGTSKTHNKRNFHILENVHITMVSHIYAIIHAICYHTCIFICKKAANTKATQARNIPAHILLSGVGLLNRGYNTPSNSGMRRMMKRALKACIWSGLNVPKNPEWI